MNFRWSILLAASIYGVSAKDLFFKVLRKPDGVTLSVEKNQQKLTATDNIWKAGKDAEITISWAGAGVKPLRSTKIVLKEGFTPYDAFDIKATQDENDLKRYWAQFRCFTSPTANTAKDDQDVTVKWDTHEVKAKMTSLQGKFLCIETSDGRMLDPVPFHSNSDMVNLNIEFIHAGGTDKFDAAIDVAKFENVSPVLIQPTTNKRMWMVFGLFKERVEKVKITSASIVKEPYHHWASSGGKVQVGTGIDVALQDSPDKPRAVVSLMNEKAFGLAFWVWLAIFIVLFGVILGEVAMICCCNRRRPEQSFYGRRRSDPDPKYGATETKDGMLGDGSWPDYPHPTDGKKSKEIECRESVIRQP